MTFAEYLKQQGKKEGEQQGLYTATINIAKNMLQKGLEIKLIKETTGLTEEEIKNLMHN